MQIYSRSADTIATVNVPAATIFAFLDDQKNLSAQMDESSWMMLGSRMEIYLDAAGARSVGSKFGFKGAILGLPLSVDEVVTQREPPEKKVWETIGQPKLWVIGPYRMSFEITPQDRAARLRVLIEYEFPKAGISRPLGILFGDFYARWCTRRMVGDAIRHFRQVATATAASAA